MIPISIVVPMYNVEKYIEACLDSLLNQSVEKEIILIDDGSTDRTYEIAERFAANNSNIVLVHQENSGQSAARNRGVEIANGEYVFFCDSDDCIDAESLPQLVKICIENELDFLKTGWKTNKKGNVEINLPLEGTLPSYQVMTAKEFFQSTIFGWYNVIPWNGLFRLAFLRKNGITFREGIQFEDNLFHLMISTVDLDARVMFVRSTFYNVNISENSTTTAKPKPKKVYDQLENVRLMNEYIATDISDEEIAKLAKVAISSLVFTMTSYYYRVDKRYRKELSEAIPKIYLKEAILYPQNRFQKYKLMVFTYCRPVLDVYEWFHMRKANV